MTTFVTIGVATLVLAGVYSLINLGVVLLYQTTGVINFAQGEYAVIAAYLATTFIPTFGVWLGLLLAVLSGAVVAALAYIVFLRHLLGAPEFAKVVATFLISLFVAQVVLGGWGTNPRQLPFPLHGGLHLHSVPVTYLDLTAIVAPLVVAVALVTLLRTTVLGIRLRELAQNEQLALYSGLRVGRLGLVAWTIGGGAAALAGLIYTAGTSVNADVGNIALSAFPAAIVGGITSLGGTLVGAFIVAVAQTVTNFYYGTVPADIVSYALMVVFILFRPTGLFGSQSVSRL